MPAVIVLLLPLGLLIWSVYRGWPVLLAAPVMALFAAALAADPLLATLTQRFMPAAGGFVVAFLPLFLLGAVFGKIMEASGAAMTLARAIVARLGPGQAIPAVVLSCAALTYGGVSLFVVAFAVYPLAVALFRAADLPHRLIPAAIALGSFTFTMSALPGSPSIQNAIPMPYFGTNVFAAPGIGVIAGLIMALGGLAWLELAARREGPGGWDAALPDNGSSGDLPPLWRALAPILTVFAANWVLAEMILPGLDLTYLADPDWGATTPERVIGLWALIGALTLAILLALALGLAAARRAKGGAGRRRSGLTTSSLQHCRAGRLRRGGRRLARLRCRERGAGTSARGRADGSRGVGQRPRRDHRVGVGRHVHRPRRTGGTVSAPGPG